MECRIGLELRYCILILIYLMTRFFSKSAMKKIVYYISGLQKSRQLLTP